MPVTEPAFSVDDLKHRSVTPYAEKESPSSTLLPAPFSEPLSFLRNDDSVPFSTDPITSDLEPDYAPEVKAASFKKHQLQIKPHQRSPKYAFDRLRYNYGARPLKIPRLSNPYLKPNAKFIGEQQLGTAKFHIKVELKTIDLVNSLVTGFLQISGLTVDHPEIYTCFTGEVINNPLRMYNWGNEHDSDALFTTTPVKKYSFITEHRNWGSFVKNDLEHWKKLTGSYKLDENQLRAKLTRIQNGSENNQFIYMRWKEEFLLPDSRVKQISGASFEGFYYVVLNIGGDTQAENNTEGRFNSNLTPGSISGLYYHAASDKFQSLSLKFVEDQGISSTFEFR